MSSNPILFVQTVLAAFEQAGLATDEEVGDAGGPSTTTLAKYRKVAKGEMLMAEPRGDVLRRIDDAAGWEIGSARALWRQGRSPSPRRPSIFDEEPRHPPLTPGNLDGFLEGLADRLTEVEERLDLLAAKLEPLSVVDDSVRDALAAHDEDVPIAGEQESPDTP